MRDEVRKIMVETAIKMAKDISDSHGAVGVEDEKTTYITDRHIREIWDNKPTRYGNRVYRLVLRLDVISNDIEPIVVEEKREG